MITLSLSMNCRVTYTEEKPEQRIENVLLYSYWYYQVCHRNAFFGFSTSTCELEEESNLSWYVEWKDTHLIFVSSLAQYPLDNMKRDAWCMTAHNAHSHSYILKPILCKCPVEYRLTLPILWSHLSTQHQQVYQSQPTNFPSNFHLPLPQASVKRFDETLLHSALVKHLHHLIYQFTFTNKEEWAECHGTECLPCFGEVSSTSQMFIP